MCLIWGSTWLFIKLGLDDLPPFTFAGIRFVIAAAILFASSRLAGLPLPRTRADWMLLAVTGVLVFQSELRPGLLGRTIHLVGTRGFAAGDDSAFGLVIAHFYLPGERMTPAKIFGVVLGVAGVGVIFSNQLSVAGPRALGGMRRAGGQALCALPMPTFWLRRTGRNFDPAILAGGQMLFGLIPLLLIGIPLEGNPLQLSLDAHGRHLASYLAIVGSVIAFLLYYWLVQHMDVTKTMLIALVTPVIAVTLGMWC